MEVFMMKWTIIWMKLFGTTSFWGINLGFWVALAAVLLIVILMNVVFWTMKPKRKKNS
jgi:hypothetical protein